MSMSTWFEALMDKDKTYQNHKKVLIACKRANINLPKETAEYFGNDSWEMAEENAVEKLRVDLIEGKHWKYIEQGNPECGFEIYVKKLPKEITKIRFINSW
jgi:hypothetical protein